MIKKIGIVGDTGRMGLSLKSLLVKQTIYQLGICYNGSSLPQIRLLDVFQDNDVIVDFSSKSLLKDILKAGLWAPKPLILCSTGWDYQKNIEDLDILSQTVPVVIAPNTSLGACVQKYLAKVLSRLFDEDYDIDIIEKHHRYKEDSPSGTAKALVESILKSRQNLSLYHLNQGPRTDNQIGISTIRSGHILGEHELLFTSKEEMISVKHTVFTRNLFAKGVLKILCWLKERRPEKGIYSMEDVIAFKKL